AQDAAAPAAAAPAVAAGTDPIFTANKVEIPEERLAIIKANKFLCHTCHKIEGAMIGPPWMAVATKYKGQTTYSFGGPGYKDFKGKNDYPVEELPLVDGLVKKVSLGGNGGGIGNWKETHGIKAPMLNNDGKLAKQAEIRDMVEFVLSLAK
ncbi:MAG: hypothetical protein ABL860_04765, partial [Candidatus Nitrotoga sp.]